MSSLTSILPLLTSHLGLSPAALYERQRALVRLGLLQKPKGRGRGSGASATPHTIGLIVLSVLATDNLSEMDDRISVIAKAPIDEWHKRKECRLTKKKKFLDALAEIIQSPQLAKRVRSVAIRRQGIHATIYWTQVVSRNVDLSQFNVFRPGATRSIDVTASIDGRALSQIAAALQTEGIIE